MEDEFLVKVKHSVENQVYCIFVDLLLRLGFLWFLSSATTEGSKAAIFFDYRDEDLQR